MKSSDPGFHSAYAALSFLVPIMPDITAPYVTSTLTAATIEAQAAGLASLNGALASSKAAAAGAVSGAIGSASSALASAIPNMPSLSGVNASVAGLTSRLGNPAALLANVPSPATMAASAMSALGLGGSGGLAGAVGASTAKLAKTTFSTGPNDKLASVDVYTADSASTPTDVSAPVPSINPLTMLATMSSYLGSAATLVNDYKKLAALPLSASSLLTGVLSSNPLIQSAFNSLPIAIQNAVVMAQVFTDLSGKNSNNPVNSISIKNNGVTSTINNSNLQDVRAMVAMANAASGGGYAPVITDNNALPVMLGNIIKVAASMQLPGAYSAIVNSLAPTPANTRIKGSLAAMGASTAISNGSLGLLSEVAKSGTPLPNKRHILNTFSKGYALAPNESSSDFALIGARLRSSYSAINPTWNKATTQAGNVNNLDSLLNSSPDLKNIMSVISAVAKIPPVVKPVTMIKVPASQVGTYVVPTPSGAVATTTTDPDGSVWYTYTFPAQAMPAPTLDPTSLAFTGPPVPGSYSLPNGTISSTAVNEMASTSDSVVVDMTLADGTTRTDTTLSNGTKQISVVDANGVVTTTTLNASVSDSDMTSALSVTGDPLAGTAYLVVSDPMIAADSVQQFCDMDIQDSADSGSPALSSMNAADAIGYSFPDSYMNDLSTMDA